MAGQGRMITGMTRKDQNAGGEGHMDMGYGAALFVCGLEHVERIRI